MDAFLGFHLINMHPPDMEKTYFITKRLVLLQSHAFWVKERRGDVLDISQQNIQGDDQKNDRGLYRRHAGQKPIS